MPLTFSQRPTKSTAGGKGGRFAGWNQRIYRVLAAISLLLLVASPLMPARASAQGQSFSPGDLAASLLSSLTPEEKVGQLFVVAFQGTDASSSSQIYDLIANHYVGGVVLKASNDNFGGVGEQTLNQAVALNRQIQQDRWSIAQQSRVDPISGNSFTPAFIPLFIGIAQEGDGYPYDQLISGMTPLPDEMAIGATWSPDLATQVGSVLGSELSTLGYNLLLGPSLDVLEGSRTEGLNDLGTRTFGGDPFWVSKMGSAYIQGVHQGSGGRLAVVATHFPGYGGSDRLPEEEVATVIKTLEQLQSFDLAPFFSVTGKAKSAEATTDGLLASHIRYQGFQGNLRSTTRPVSFDPQALNLLLSLPDLDSWRKNGGLVVSDDLSNRAVRRYYDLNDQPYDPRRVIQNAIQAGNDLLYVADFSTADTDSYTSAVHTLDFFSQKYREDNAFAQRVDQSVLRILTLKYKLYHDFSYNSVFSSENGIAEIGKAGQITDQVARQAATLISPSLAELDNRIPDPPNLNDRIVFISDARTGQQCSQCPPQALLDQKGLEKAVLRRYGPQADGRVYPNNLISYSLTDLKQMLDSGRGNSALEQDLRRSHWIVFGMLDARTDVPSFDTLSRFLSERPDLFQQKRIVVFAFNAPYNLDATNITKLTAYFGLYSKAPQFIDVAAVLLFRELLPGGSLPVSVPGVAYDLNTALFPDPNQLIHLELDVPGPGPSQGTVTPEPTSPPPIFHVGEVIPIRTGVILDHNGHAVPDGTQVEFILSSSAGETSQIEETKNGLASTTFLISNSGTQEIRARSELAQSERIKFDVPAPNGEAPQATATPQPTETPTPTPTPTVTPIPEAAGPVEPPNRPQLGDWIMAILLASTIAWSSYRLAALIGQVRWGVRGGFLALIGGLAAYSYLALHMPGSEGILHGSVARGVFLITLFGSGLGLAIAWSWRAVGSSQNGKTS